MKHKNYAWLSILILLGVLLAACGSSAPKVDWDLQITGAVDQSLTLSYSDLTKMSQVELNEVLMEKSQGPDEVTSWSGVPLEEIFAQAGVDSNYVSITALAADGYAVEISRDELQDGIVALKDREGWIVNTDSDHGPIRLVCPHTPANRWVFQLSEIQVMGP
jgi:DMSO/TMAO reductase YedYZ molybdopterin-dependent catalytic subunit